MAFLEKTATHFRRVISILQCIYKCIKIIVANVFLLLTANQLQFAKSFRAGTEHVPYLYTGTYRAGRIVFKLTVAAAHTVHAAMIS